MAKTGRLFVPLDVNWYDEWGHAVSPEAALLWVIALTTCKRMRSDGVLTVAQLRRMAPTGTTDARFAELLHELNTVDVAPISCDGQQVLLHGWAGWHDLASDYESASESGLWGNHVRWHVKEGNPSSDCGYCTSGKVPTQLTSGLSGGDARPDSKSRVEKSRLTLVPTGEATATYEADFATCWEHYPRKIARKAALKAYIAQRRKAIPAEVLLAATQHYAKAMQLEDRAPERILHGATFFGPNDRWEDYVSAPAEPPAPVVAQGAGRLRLEDYAHEMGDTVVLPGEVL